MVIAYTMTSGPGDTDLVLTKAATRLRQSGVRTCGTTQINSDNPKTGRCDMDVQVLPDGPVIRISQSLGKNSCGCRLDSAALEMAVGLVEAELGKGAQLLIVNKFGKQEAEGGGFRDVIARAASDGIPVLVGLNSVNKPAFEAFAGGLAEPVPATEADVLDWAEGALKARLRVA